MGLRDDGKLSKHDFLRIWHTWLVCGIGFLRVYSVGIDNIVAVCIQVGAVWWEPAHAMPLSISLFASSSSEKAMVMDDLDFLRACPLASHPIWVIFAVENWLKLITNNTLATASQFFLYVLIEAYWSREKSPWKCLVKHEYLNPIVTLDWKWNDLHL